MKKAVLLMTLALAGCATQPQAIPVLTTVEKPVAACPAVLVPPLPAEAPLVSRAPADVIRTAELRIEQWKAYALQLRALLTPFERPTTPEKP